MSVELMKEVHAKEVLEIAVSQYRNQCQRIAIFREMGFKAMLKQGIEKAVQENGGMVYIEEGKVLGYVIVEAAWDVGEQKNYFIPLWGYGAVGEQRRKILSMLFQQKADELCQEKKVQFMIKVYEYDDEAIRLFSLLQFGIQSEECIRSVREKIGEPKDFHIYEMDKEVLTKRWGEVWNLLDKLINHLRKSPVFYKGEEFTEELYREFFQDQQTRVIVAEDDGKLIGVIQASPGGTVFSRENQGIRSVGEAYVLSSYRGTHLAQALLKYANDLCKEEGISKLVVEHGTANPNARGFWDKYFHVYSYSMNRIIEPVCMKK